MDVKALYHQILSQVPDVCFSVRFWDDELVTYGAGPPDFRLDLRDPSASKSLLGNLELRFGEAYMRGDVEIHGDWRKFAQTIFLLDRRAFALSWTDKLKVLLMRFSQRNSLGRAKQNIAQHYDLGNDFFRLWLGRDLVYTCAYFCSENDDIDTAQTQKMELICRKLRLQSTDHLLDIGCGWGGLLAYAAKHYGVRGLGITLSQEQQVAAQERIAVDGLGARVTIRQMDYRDLPLDQRFTKVVSIGMLEHVGQANYPEYFRRTARLLADGGIGLLHTIGNPAGSPPNPWLGKYIFPGCYFPSLPDIVAPLCASGLCPTDLEDLRPHYALTLERWILAFEDRKHEVEALYGESFVRMWRLYLNSCAASFRYGPYHLWQIQFTQGNRTILPLTRDYLTVRANSDRDHPEDNVALCGAASTSEANL
jgi:cyclopropane-fatty-acyl-phospholipid synthase